MEQDYAMAGKMQPVDGTAAPPLTHSEFRGPSMLVICTGNIQYAAMPGLGDGDSDSDSESDGDTVDTLTAVREEVSNLSTTDQKQDADMTEASRRDDIADLKARGIKVAALHGQSDNKDMEWKNGKVVDQLVDRANGKTPYIKPFQFARCKDRGCLGCETPHTPGPAGWADGTCQPSQPSATGARPAAASAPSSAHPARAAPAIGEVYDEYVDKHYQAYIDTVFERPPGCECAECTATPQRRHYEPAMPRSTLSFGAPHHGKCDCDACGGRIKLEANLQRRSGDIIGDQARQISAGLMAKKYNPDKKVYRRSVTHDLTRAGIEAVEADRQSKRPGSYPGTKMARQIHWSVERQAAGRRFLQCYCLSCAADRCDVKQFTGGEPVWWQTQPRDLPAAVATPVMAPEPEPTATAAVPSTAAAAPMATADSDAVAEESTELDEGDHVAIAHDDADFDQFKYYLLRVGKAPPGGWPETLGRNHGEEDFAEGDRVVRGVLLEPVSSNPGPGVYEPSDALMITHVENVVVNLASELPRRACLADGPGATSASFAAGTKTLTPAEDDRLFRLMPAE